MVLPLVPLAIIVASSVTGASGTAVGTVGGVQMKRSQAQMRTDRSRYAERKSIHHARVNRTTAALQSLGMTQKQAQNDVIFRMKDFLERHAKQVKANEHLIYDGVDSSGNHVVAMTTLDPDVAGWVRGVVKATISGVATQTAVRTGVVQLATAGTGTAISTLSGAAAESATLAFLGGGTLVSGGGGVALGTTMLNVATVGPAILIAGLTVKNRGTKAKTEAARFCAEVDVAVAQFDVKDEVLRVVRVRACEVHRILVRLMSRATEAMDLLESEPFLMDVHAERLQAALILVKSVRDVATAPIVDDEGELNSFTEHLVIKYREADKET